jgi:hypothetical protein
MGTAAGAYNTPGAVAGTYTKNRNAVESAVNAYSSRFEASRSKGHSPLVAGVSALGGALWGAYRESQAQGSQTQNAGSPTWGNEAAMNNPSPLDPANLANPTNPMNSGNVQQDNGTSGTGATEEI